jgi:hypothetical protein
MDFLDPAKKRAHQKRLFLGYFLIGIAILLGSIILVFSSYGFDIDKKTGEIIQNGLIFADSSPEPSKIFLNGKENGTTDKRLVVPAGDYTLELKREGYRPWKRSFYLEGSSIERLIYPVLFPEKLTTEDRATYDVVPNVSIQSPDRRWILVSQANSLTKFDMFDANNPNDPAEPVVMPTEILTTKPGESQTLTLVEWSTDNRHALLKHTVGAAVEYIMLDRTDPAKSTNLNKLLGTNPTLITLRDKKFDKLYLYDAVTQVLSTADTVNKEIKEFATKVITYKSHGSDTVVYTTLNPKDPNKQQVVLKDDSKTFILRDAKSTESFLLEIARYDGHWYIAATAVNEGKVFIYRDPASQSSGNKKLPSLSTTLRLKQPTQVSFSANTRFIMTQSANKFAVYDAETGRRHYYTLDDLALPIDSKATWMDGHRLLINFNNKVIVFDYDGINKQSLVPIAANTKPFFDREYTRLYTVAPSVSAPAKTALTRANLKLNVE